MFTLPVKLLPCACGTNQSEAVSSGRLQIIDVSARVGMVRIVGLCFPHCIGPGEKSPWHCFGLVVGEEGMLGGGVFIYNLGFVCTVSVSS